MMILYWFETAVSAKFAGRRKKDCRLAIWGGLLLLVADCVSCVNRSSRAVESEFDGVI